MDRVGWGERSDAQRFSGGWSARWASLRSPQPTYLLGCKHSARALNRLSGQAGGQLHGDAMQAAVLPD